MLEKRLAALVPHWDLGEVTAIQPLVRGLSNQNFLLDYLGVSYVLRLGRADFRANPAEAEAWACRSLSLPELIAADWTRGDLLTKCVERPCLAETGSTLDALCDFLIGLHASLPKRFGQDYPLDQIIRLGNAQTASVAHRIERLEEIHFIKESCHNDLNAWNILVQGTKPREWMAVDWEWAGNGSRLFDAVNLALFLGFDTGDAYLLAERCGYHDAAKYGPFELIVERYWLREYGFAASQVAAGATSPFLQEQMEACLSALKRLE